MSAAAATSRPPSFGSRARSKRPSGIVRHTVGPIAAALSGMSEMSGLPSPAPPAGWGYSFLDWFGAYAMALSVLGALYHRDRTGEGQRIDASQTEAGIMLTQVLDRHHLRRRRSVARAGGRGGGGRAGRLAGGSAVRHG
jgi:crotonobetainyl-CoA:carnitine CoA-transferase CaiB-like acyl-CoA transferase